MLDAAPMVVVAGDEVDLLALAPQTPLAPSVIFGSCVFVKAEPQIDDLADRNGQIGFAGRRTHVWGTYPSADVDAAVTMLRAIDVCTISCFWARETQIFMI